MSIDPISFIFDPIIQWLYWLKVGSQLIGCRKHLFFPTCILYFTFNSHNTQTTIKTYDMAHQTTCINTMDSQVHEAHNHNNNNNLQSCEEHNNHRRITILMKIMLESSFMTTLMHKLESITHQHDSKHKTLISN